MSEQIPSAMRAVASSIDEYRRSLAEGGCNISSLELLTDAYCCVMDAIMFVEQAERLEARV